jgi:hypothetical protein
MMNRKYAEGSGFGKLKKNANFSGELFEPKENEVNSCRMLHN